MSSAFLETIYSFIPKDNVLLDEPMSKHTTFRVGGEARYFIQIETGQQIAKLVKYLKQVDRNFLIVGNGSNLLICDNGYDGVVLQLGETFSNVTVSGNEITASAGASLAKISKVAMDHGLTGLEFASGIPGTIGGAAVMNAGAYDGEMKNVITKVVVTDYEGNILELDNATMEYGYRSSIIRNKPFVVLEVTMKLQSGAVSEIQEKMENFTALRKEKQPLEFPSAGSTFKRPQGNFAGKLIMDAGLRGFQIGGARVSEKHCGFVINTGNATASDIYEIICEIKLNVKEKFGVELEPEVVFIGDFE